MLSHAGNGVGMVVLDGRGRYALLCSEILRKVAGKIAWMQIVNHQLRLDLQQSHEMLADRFEIGLGGHEFKVAEMLADKGFSAAAEADGAFDVGTDGKGGPTVKGECERQGGEAAGPAQVNGRPDAGAHYRVVGGCEDGAVMKKEGIADGGQFDKSFVVAGDDRLPGQIGRGHDQGGD